MTSGLILFFYIGAHLFNHALGLISLETAEAGMAIGVEVWYSPTGTVLLYGAAATHFVLALWAVYERRTFRLPPAELLRIALGFSLPIVLIGHAVATRIGYELFGLSSDYSRVISQLLASNSEVWQLGVMAPGWLHGCLGLHLAFSRRPWYRRLRFVLFAIALLLPVLSALGMIIMGRQISADPKVAEAVAQYMSPANAAQRQSLSNWRDGIVTAYFVIIGAAFGARELRNFLERRSQRLVTISFPGRNVRVPRGWTALEASRSFHLPHASMCGGRARCSTCRVRITAGEENCPPAGADEQATLDRIGAPDDVRLACQLRPQGDISVVPLVRTERPVYRATAPKLNTERDIVVMFCDFLNRGELARDHLPQDLLYVLTLYVEALNNAIRSARGTVSYIELDSVCALFGVDRGIDQAAQAALQAVAAIERVITDINNRLGRQWDCKMNVVVSVHAGRAAVGEIGMSDPPTVIAIGEAVDVANVLRKTAAAQGKPFAISESVYAAAGLDLPEDDRITVQLPGSAPVLATLAATGPHLPPSWKPLGVPTRRAALQRLWSGG
ncbi:MAG: 2Fe-2S iron-sulfur cluster-binding protein [Xanthobacteraceae bacterium]